MAFTLTATDDLGGISYHNLDEIAAILVSYSRWIAKGDETPFPVANSTGIFTLTLTID